MKKTIAAIATFSLISGTTGFAQTKRFIRLDSQGCIEQLKRRKIIDSFSDKLATVFKNEQGYQLLIISKVKFIPCNLPKLPNGTKLIVSGYVLMTFNYEKVIATPIVLRNAKYN